mgnify:CR=1 FL=1
MQDLRKIFRYARPYRRDLFAAVGLIFIECIFEMVIPVLMSTLVDDGVPTHNMAVIFRQGGLMILCAVLALITGLLYARYAARFANGFASELRLAEYAADRLSAVEGLRIYGTTPDKCSILSFNAEGVHAYDMGMILDKLGIAVRTGAHCADPVMEHYGVKGMVRASFAFYNTEREADALVAGVERAVRMLR